MVGLYIDNTRQYPPIPAIIVNLYTISCIKTSIFTVEEVYTLYCLVACVGTPASKNASKKPRVYRSEAS